MQNLLYVEVIFIRIFVTTLMSGEGVPGGILYGEKVRMASKSVALCDCGYCDSTMF